MQGVYATHAQNVSWNPSIKGSSDFVGLGYIKKSCCPQHWHQ